MKTKTTLAVFNLALGAAFALPARAQEVLPRPGPKFKGIIGRTYKDSTPDKIPLIKAPAGAPNVLFIMIDDAGFGDWSTLAGRFSLLTAFWTRADGLPYWTKVQ
jgi:hypothetical protein